jgi:cation:H+ antiporter
MTSIFIFISGATLLVYSAERLIGSLVGISRGLAISVFLLAIIFTGIEFDDIVLGIALNLEDDQDVALGLVIGTAVSFSGIVLALGAIIAPTKFSVPREYIVVFALAPLLLLFFAVRKEVTMVDAAILVLLFVVWIVFVAVKESRRATPTFRNLEVVEEYEDEDEEAAPDGPDDAVRAQAADTMSLFRRQGRWSGWINLGVAIVAIGGIVIGAATVSEGTDQILNRYTIEGTVFGATVVTAVLTIEDLFLTVRPIRLGVPEIGIGNVIGSLIFSVTGKLGIVVLAGGSVEIGSSVLRWHLPALFVLTGVAAGFMWTGSLKRWHGFVLLGLYVAYWVVSYVVYGGAPVED